MPKYRPSTDLVSKKLVSLRLWGSIGVRDDFWKNPVWVPIDLSTARPVVHSGWTDNIVLPRLGSQWSIDHILISFYRMYIWSYCQPTKHFLIHTWHEAMRMGMRKCICMNRAHISNSLTRKCILSTEFCVHFANNKINEYVEMKKYGTRMLFWMDDKRHTA